MGRNGKKGRKLRDVARDAAGAEAAAAALAPPSQSQGDAAAVARTLLRLPHAQWLAPACRGLRLALRPALVEASARYEAAGRKPDPKHRAAGFPGGHSKKRRRAEPGDDDDDDRQRAPDAEELAAAEAAAGRLFAAGAEAYFTAPLKAVRVACGPMLGWIAAAARGGPTGR